VDVEIISLTEIIKILKIKHNSKTQALLACASRRAGGLSNIIVIIIIIIIIRWTKITIDHE